MKGLNKIVLSLILICMLPLHVFAEESLVKNSMNESDAEVAVEGKNTNNIDNSDLYVEVKPYDCNNEFRKVM